MNLKRGVWFVVSALLHVAVVLLMLQAIVNPRAFIDLGGRDVVTEAVVRIQHTPPVEPEEPRVEIPPPVREPPPPVLAPPAVDAAPPVAPPAAVAVTPPRADTGSGPPAVSGVPVPGKVGIPGGSPDYTDRRIWGSPAGAADIPVRTGIDAIRYGLDSAMRVTRAYDSVVAGRRSPTDWTVGKGDRKVGLDEKWMYLGPVKIPTLLLGLIPMNGVQANPNMRENARTLGVMAAEVRERGALDAARGDERKAIRARMERQRAAAAKAGGGGSQ